MTATVHEFRPPAVTDTPPTPRWDLVPSVAAFFASLGMEPTDLMLDVPVRMDAAVQIGAAMKQQQSGPLSLADVTAAGVTAILAAPPS